MSNENCAAEDCEAKVGELLELVALGWPRYRRPDGVDVARVMSPRGLLVGWWYDPETGLVGEGCTDGHRHSVASVTRPDAPGAYPPHGWFYTEADALRALRLHLSEDAARVLAGVDARVAEVERSAGPGLLLGAPTPSRR